MGRKTDTPDRKIVKNNLGAPIPSSVSVLPSIQDPHVGAQLSVEVHFFTLGSDCVERPLARFPDKISAMNPGSLSTALLPVC